MKGREVLVEWNGRRYAATIRQVRPDGTYDVAYSKYKNEYEDKVTADRISFSVISEERVVTAGPSSCEEQEQEPVLYVSDYRVHHTRRKEEGFGVDADFHLSFRPAKDGVVYQKVTMIYSIDGDTDEVKHITEAWIVRGKGWKGKGVKGKRVIIEQGGTDSFLVPYQGVMSGAGWLEIKAVAWFETGKVDGEMTKGASRERWGGLHGKEGHRMVPEGAATVVRRARAVWKQAAAVTWTLSAAKVRAADVQQRSGMSRAVEIVVPGPAPMHKRAAGGSSSRGKKKQRRQGDPVHVGGGGSGGGEEITEVDAPALAPKAIALARRLLYLSDPRAVDNGKALQTIARDKEVMKAMALLSPVCTSEPDAYDHEHGLRRLVIWRRGGADIVITTHTVLPFGRQLRKTYAMLDESLRACLTTTAVPAEVRFRFVGSGFVKCKLGGLLFYAKEKGLGVLALTCKACNAGKPPMQRGGLLFYGKKAQGLRVEPRESSREWWEHWEDQHHPKMQQQQNKYGQARVDGDLMCCEITTTSTQLLAAAAEDWDGTVESAPHSLLWAVLVLFLKAPYAMRLAATSTGRGRLEELHRAAKAGQQRSQHEQYRRQEARFAVTGMGGRGKHSGYHPRHAGVLGWYFKKGALKGKWGGGRWEELRAFAVQGGGS